ncbi:unnamed protein product [Ixodes hexagonus]
MKPKLVHPKQSKQRLLTNAFSVSAGKIGKKKRSRLKKSSQSSTAQTAFDSKSASFGQSPNYKAFLESDGLVKHEPSPTAKRKGGDAKNAVRTKRKRCLDAEASGKPATKRGPKSRKHEPGKRAELKNEPRSEARLLEELRSGVTSILSGLDPEENFERARALHCEKSRLVQAPRNCVSQEGQDERRNKRRKNKKKAAVSSGDPNTTTKANDPMAPEVDHFSDEPATSRKRKTAKKQTKTSKALPTTRPGKQGKRGRGSIPINVDTDVAKGAHTEKQQSPTKHKKRKRHRRHAPSTPLDDPERCEELSGSKSLARLEGGIKRPKGEHNQECAANSRQDEFSDDDAAAGVDIFKADEAFVTDATPPQDTKKAKIKWSSSSAPASSKDVRERALERLRAAQFRLLNEKLYTSQSADAVRSFENDPNAFQVYHKGFERQVSKWPVNPVDIIIESLRNMPNSTVIADLGCGEAKIAHTLTNKQVHSFDLKALNERVTVCDMSRLPLYRQTVDVAVFCLSLMGTNLNAFILEANRILKKGGLLKIAEVKSRFKNIDGFPKAMKKFGFQLVQKNDSNKMFVLFDFKKLRSTSRHPYLPELKLMPCLYKKR